MAASLALYLAIHLFYTILRYLSSLSINGGLPLKKYGLLKLQVFTGSMIFFDSLFDNEEAAVFGPRLKKLFSDFRI